MAVKKVIEDKHEHCDHHHNTTPTTGNGVYGLGMIGTAFYFLQNAHTVSEVLMGIFKAIFWPAILAYQAFSLLKI